MSEKQLETLKLLTIAAICYQKNINIITSKIKDNSEIAELYFELPTVQYTHNIIKLSRLSKSGIDVNKITSIDDVMNIFEPKESIGTKEILKNDNSRG